MKQVNIDDSYKMLLQYIAKYRQLRGKASARTVTQQLILAYAKQLATGMPEQLWRKNILTLINRCEDEQSNDGRVQNRVRRLRKKEGNV